jgi:hypothetical protein
MARPGIAYQAWLDANREDLPEDIMPEEDTGDGKFLGTEAADIGQGEYDFGQPPVLDANGMPVVTPEVTPAVTPTVTPAAPVVTTPTVAPKTQAQIDAELKKADEFAKKQKASDAMVAVFKSYGIESLAKFIGDEIMADVSPEALLIKLYDQPEYQARFPGMKALQAKNRTITEDAYIKAENTIKQTLSFFDLPPGFYDNREMMGKIIGNEVSPKEVQDRAQAAQDLAKSTNSDIRAQLKNFYGLGEGAITAYLLNADIAGPLVLKQARSAEIAALGARSGMAGFGTTESEELAANDIYKNMGFNDLSSAMGKAGQLAQNQRRLSYIENQSYSDQEALKASVEGDQKALMASQQRALREMARFAGSSGLTSGSLKESSGL